MKKFIALALVIFFCVYGKAENLMRWGVMGGLNYTNISGIDGNGWKLGYKGGIISDIPLNARFSFQPALLFSSKGFKEKSGIGWTDPQGNPYLNVTLANTANYIELPLLFALKVPASKSTFSVSAGPYIAYGVGGKTTLSANGKDFISWNTFDGGGDLELMKLNRFDWGFSAGIAEEIGRFKISLNYDQGCQNVFSTSNEKYSGGFTDGNWYNYGFTLGLGVYF